MTAPRRPVWLSGWRDGKIHPPGIVDHRALQRFGKLGEPRHAGRRAGEPITEKNRVLGRHQHSRQLLDRAGIGLRRDHPGDFGNAQRFGVTNWIFLQLGVERDEHRPHRRRRCDLVGAHHRLGEMLQRGRLIVPLDEVAHDRAGIDRGVHPFGAGRALIGLHDIAAEHDHRHAVAPGVVHRHGGVLQADHAMADHGERLALNLGVALPHMHRDLLVRTGEDLGLRVLGVVDDRLMQAAEARGAVHRQIVDVERLEDVDHEVAAARRLCH